MTFNEIKNMFLHSKDEAIVTTRGDRVKNSITSFLFGVTIGALFGSPIVVYFIGRVAV